jgi:hypothetical protein
MGIIKAVVGKLERGNLITYLIYTSYFLYAIVFLGLFYVDSYYIDILKLVTQTYIAITLIYYFSPFSSFIELTANMRSVIFSSAFILLLNNMNTLRRTMLYIRIV